MLLSVTTPSILSQPHPRPQGSSLDNPGNFSGCQCLLRLFSLGLLRPRAYPSLREAVGSSGKYTGVEPGGSGLTLGFVPY